MEHRLLSLVRRAAGDGRSDAELLTRLDDHAAFAELVGRHGPLVWNVCRNLLGEADAEDAFQATFLALIRATVRDGAALASWLHGVALRVSLAARREAGRRRRRERGVAVHEATRVPDDWADTMAAIHQEVARLPDADRVAFVLCVLEGLTQVEAAASLGRPLGAVAGQVARAKKRLVERLTGRGVVPGLAALGAASAADAVPLRLVTRARGLPGAASPAVLRLARGAVVMTTSSTKLIAAALLVGAVLVTGAFSAPGVPPADAPVGRAAADNGSPAVKQPDATRKGPGVVLVGDKGTESARAADAAALLKKLQGKWTGRGSCQGDVTFDADGAYYWVRFGPGSATVAGKWSMRWDALPPTLVMASVASTDKDYVGARAEVKVIQLDAKSLAYEQDGHKVEFTRERDREPTKQNDVTLLRGRWKVVKEEYRDGARWADVPVPPDFAFAVSATGLTVTRGKTSRHYRLELRPDEKVMNLVSAEGGVGSASKVIYRLQGDRVWISVVSGGVLSADGNASRVRQYLLERVVEK